MRIVYPYITLHITLVGIWYCLKLRSFFKRRKLDRVWVSFTRCFTLIILSYLWISASDLYLIITLDGMTTFRFISAFGFRLLTAIAFWQLHHNITQNDRIR